MNIDKFQTWLDDEIYNDRIDISIKERREILEKLKELNKEVEE